jgi:uncharacterized protein
MSDPVPLLPPGCRIIEGVMTTLSPPPPELPPELSPGETVKPAMASRDPRNSRDPRIPESRVNIAPMGPIVDERFERFILRPFRTSTTYRNIKATGQSVFHVVDDALLLARAAVGKVVPGPQLPVKPAEQVEGLVLLGACRYYELVAEDMDDSQDPVRIVMRAVRHRRLRDFAGFNRAAHGVLEAAILATRLHLTGAQPVLAKLAELDVIVRKTGSERELQAMAELTAYVTRWQASGLVGGVGH